MVREGREEAFVNYMITPAAGNFNATELPRVRGVRPPKQPKLLAAKPPSMPSLATYRSPRTSLRMPSVSAVKL